MGTNTRSRSHALHTRTHRTRWSVIVRPAVAAMLALVLATPLAAAQEPEPLPPRQVWTVFTTVEAVVQDNYATVKVIADIGNRGPDPEFPFQVRVPDTALVTGLTIERDGTVHEAWIAPRDAARQTYEAWKAQEETGGLIEKTRGSSVYAYLINVAEFTSVRAVLTYELYLAAEQSIYTLPLEAPVSGFGQDLGAAFDVTIRHADGVEDAWGWVPEATDPTRAASSAGEEQPIEDGIRITHRVGARPDDASTPFAVSYLLDPTAEAGSLRTAIHNGTGYFAHRFRAPEETRELPIDLVLVLDTSGSMGGLKMRQMQDAASQVVGMLSEEDRLHVVSFSSGASSLWPGLLPADAALRADAADTIRQLLAGGGTNIGDAIHEGFSAFDGINWTAQEGRLPLLVFLTDGQASTGVTDREQLRQQAIEANANGVRVFALAFGHDADWALVQGLAADGSGTALRVPEGAGAEVDLRRFMSALTTPVLKDIVVRYDNGVTAYGTSADVLFAGSELLLVGLFDAELDALTGTVEGTAADGPRSYEFRVDPREADPAPFLPRLVVYHEILRLQALINAEGPRQDWVDEVVRLGLEHSFVTDHTSLVLTLEPRTPTPAIAGAPADAEESADSAPTRSSSAGTAPPPSGSGSFDESARADASEAAPTQPLTTGGSAGDDQDTMRDSFLRSRDLHEDPAESPIGWVVALAAIALAAVALRRHERT